MILPTFEIVATITAWSLYYECSRVPRVVGDNTNGHCTGRGPMMVSVRLSYILAD